GTPGGGGRGGATSVSAFGSPARGVPERTCSEQVVRARSRTARATSRNGAAARNPLRTDLAMDLTIVVVSYNTRELTLRCIESVQRETRGLHFELIVVDNASADGSAAAIRERFPAVRLIASEQNLGFARANNLAVETARGEYLLLLNPDTEVLDGAVQTL